MGANMVAADMALAGIESKIPVDEVINAMYQVGAALPTAFRIVNSQKAGLLLRRLVADLHRRFWGKRMKTKVYFIRHTEPNYDNHDDISRELSPKGLQDSQQIVTILRDEQIDYFYSSPYKSY